MTTPAMALRHWLPFSVLAALWFLSPRALQAQFLYTTNNGAITITGYTGADRLVIIPSTTNGLPVTTLEPTLSTATAT